MPARAHRRLPPGVRRVHRLKLLTAVSLLAALAVGLLLYGVVVATADAAIERDRVDALLRRHVATAVRQVDYDSFGVVVVGFADNEALANGYPQLYVVEMGRKPVARKFGTNSGGYVVFMPDDPKWFGVATVEAAQSVVRAAEGSEPDIAHAVGRTAPGGEEEQLRLLAVPVPDDQGTIAAVVVAVASLTAGNESHARLVGYMWWSAGALLLLSLFIAVLLARGRFWLIDQALVRHEQFLHDTAHELRSPIATLRVIAEAGLAGDEPPRRALERAMRVVQSTDQLIDDLMTLTRIETGREPLEVERVRLDLLVEELVSRRADVPAVVLKVQPTVAVVNPELVRRAVGNLVENAIRHGRANDRSAEISVTVGKGRVTVADRGVGVAPPILTYVLERANAGRRHSGSGLGLAIAGWVARLHNGRLEAANRSDGGAAFTLQLPPAD